MADFCQSDPDLIVDGPLRERVQYLKRDPEGVREMCRISEEIFNEGVREGIERGIEQGIEQGIERGIEQGIERGSRQTLLDNVRSLMEGVGWSAQQALDALRVPESERARYLAQL